MMIAVKRILDKLVNVCGTAPDDIAVICLTVELYLCALSGFYNSAEKPSGDSAKQRVTDVLIFLILWLQRPEVGLGETFGGENANKIKDELKVMFISGIILMAVLRSPASSMAHQCVIYTILMHM